MNQTTQPEKNVQIFIERERDSLSVVCVLSASIVDLTVWHLAQK